MYEFPCSERVVTVGEGWRLDFLFSFLFPMVVGGRWVYLCIAAGAMWRWVCWVGWGLLSYFGTGVIRTLMNSGGAAFGRAVVGSGWVMSGISGL